MAKGRTEIVFRADLSQHGLRVTSVSADGSSDGLDLSDITVLFKRSPEASITVSQGVLDSLDGVIRHDLGVTLVGPGGRRVISPILLRMADQPGRFVVPNSADDPTTALILGDMSTALDPVSGTLILVFDRITLSGELSSALGVALPDGFSLGYARSEIQLTDLESPTEGIATEGMAAEAGPGTGCPGSTNPPEFGPDVIVGNLTSIASYGGTDGISAFAIGTDSCNIGDDCLKWIASNNEHPVIAQNMYRLKNDRFEQIGMSWLKHGFTALAGNTCLLGCTNPLANGALLGVGCSDPYSASLNGTRSILGPRSQVNAHTGLFTFPRDIPNSSCFGCDTIDRRLQVHNDDLNNPGAQYFVESQYVSRDDAEWGNGNNNASYRNMFFAQPRCDFNPQMLCDSDAACTGPGRCANNFSAACESESDCPGSGRCEINVFDSCDVDADCPGSGEACIKCRPDECGWPSSCPSTLPLDGFCANATGSTQREQAAIRAWRDHDVSVVETDVQIPGEGLLLLAAKAVEIGGGRWRYEYAVENLNSDRAAGSFSIPLPTGAIVEGVGFGDVDYHSGEPYAVTRCMTCETTPSVTCASASDCPNTGDRCLADDNACPGSACGGVCSGGGNEGNACVAREDCSTCNGGANFGSFCVTNDDCRTCNGGINDGVSCGSSSDCLTCAGGTNSGAACVSNAGCQTCSDGSPCTTSADCPVGNCLGVCIGSCTGSCVGSCTGFCEIPSCQSNTDCLGGVCDVARGVCNNEWPATVTPNSITWSTTEYTVDPFANAIRWGTLYNFWFEASAAPDTTTATIGLFKPGVLGEVSADTVGPALGMVDCNGNGVPDSCDLDCSAPGCAPPCGGSSDCNSNGVPDEICEPDCNGNGIADDCDIAVADGGSCEGSECSTDCQPNTVPDECEPDCNQDGVPDECAGFEDCDGDGIGDCEDACPCTTPAGSCVCPNDGCCFIEVLSTCFGPPFTQASCEGAGSGHTWICDHSACRDGCLVGDWDSDGDVDIEDAAAFQNCFSGPLEDPGFVPPSTPCLTTFDFDGDDDIDHGDFKELEANLTEPIGVFTACPGLCTQCATDADCDDANACTSDACQGSTCVNTPIADCVPCDASYACSPIQVVFAVDTSGSILDEASVLCTEIEQIVADLQALGLSVEVDMLGISEIPGGFDCLTDTVLSLLCDPVGCTSSVCSFPGGAFPSESWGPATAVIAQRYSWTPGATRIIIPLGDEGPCNGSFPDGCNIDGDDGASIDEAIASANSRGIVVSPITGTGSDACTTQLAATLADATGGMTFDAQDASADLPTAITQIILASCTPDDSCDDGDACTSGDNCVDGVCNGEPIPACESCSESGICDDGDLCTVDACVQSTCVFTPTFDEAAECCNPSTGAITPLDDGDPCTADSCDPQSGAALHGPGDNGTPCDDGLFCNGSDTCLAGECSQHAGDPCSGGAECADTCNEQNDSCHTQAGTPCTDDGEACTDNVCDGLGNCTAINNTSPCDDGVFCNGTDSCSSGLCSMHTGDPCSGGVECGDTCNDQNDSCNTPASTPCTNDGEACTDNVCDGSGNCTAVNNADACDDGVYCNGTDTCSGGSCSVHAGDPCSGGLECGDACSEASDTCSPPTGTPCTDDGNPCTDNVCDAQGNCIAVNNTAECDDGLFCNGTDTCSGGNCSVHTNDPCSGGGQCADTCDESADSCNALSGTPCPSDGNECTDNVCDGTGACTAVNNTASCDDGLFCNGADTCSGGTCSVHAGNPCSGGPACADDCDELGDACDAAIGTPCTADNNVCTDDACDGAGSCVATGNTEPCNDEDICTINDTCDGAGFCAGTPSNDPSCVDIAEICLKAVRGSLETEGCFTETEDVVVNIMLMRSPTVITGGQVKIDFDPTQLQAISVVPGSGVDATSPFSEEILEVVNNVAGSIFYVVGVAPGEAGTTGPAVMGQIRFQSLMQCENIGPLCFTEDPLPNMALTDDLGQKVPFTVCCSGDLKFPDTASEVSCPPDVNINADAGTFKGYVTWDPAEVVSGCLGKPELACTATHSTGINIDHLIWAGGLFPAGTATFECQTADGCGEGGSCSWTVEISPLNSFEVKVQLSPTMVPGPLHRCIEFQFFSNCLEPPFLVKDVLQFGLPFSLPGQATNVAFKVPAGKYVCVTARDPLHTLRAVSNFEILNGQTFLAQFDGPPLFGGNWLSGGNLNGDGVIDAIDFGIFSALQGIPVTADTTCDTLGPHADINGDGLVDELDLFFISDNFLDADKDSCCPGSLAGRADPIREIAVEDLASLGLEELRVADLNGDGLINVEDVQYALRNGFSAGSKPVRESSRR